MPRLCLLTALVAALLACGRPAHASAAVYEIRDGASVKVRAGFWQPWLERNRRVTLPHILKMCEEAGALRDFDRAAGKRDGRKETLSISDETVYKAIEAAARELGRHADPVLDRQLDAIIARVAAAQEPDGYLHTPYQIATRLGKTPPAPFADNGRGLELYFCGHLYEAAAAHFRATGKRSLLDVALKNAELVDRTFGPGKRVDVCEHPEIEPALVKLYEATGDERWWKLAEFFVATRGTTDGGRQRRGGFSQDHAPLVAQTEAVGQAPRATYFYSGATDVAALTGNDDYRQALETLWDNVVSRKLYITGGVGSRHANEGFGENYELPNLTAYTEVCAAVSFSMWNGRMFRLTGNARYMDALERTLYNNFLAGVSQSGDRFFYACPPESDGRYAFNRGWLPKDWKGPYMQASATRKPWFECACCPPNWSRWLVQVPGFAYAAGDDTVFVNLFLASQAKVPVASGELQLIQETRYPWDGGVRLEVGQQSRMPSPNAPLAIAVRIPGWAREEPVASHLYRYLDAGEPAPVRIQVNGQSAPLETEKGYAVIRRVWKPGDIVALELPMPVRRVVAHAPVTDLAGRVAIERGPVVYCAEGVDHGGHALDLSLPDDSPLVPDWDAAFADGVVVFRGEAMRRESRVPLRLIPHFTWANRGVTEMAVWLKRTGTRP